MRIIDYDLIKELQSNPDFKDYLAGVSAGREIAALMHYFAEKHGYSQTDAYKMAHVIANELRPSTSLVS